ncbi:MAG: S8 family serine peptidase, partial [Halobacteriota archaeon]
FLQLTGTGLLLLTAGAGAALLSEPRLRTRAIDAVSGEASVVDEAIATYSTLGERYYDAKVLDTRDGEIRRVLLDGNNDRVAHDEVQRREVEAYRARYGKLEPSLGTRVADANPDDKFDVSVWLSGVDHDAVHEELGADGCDLDELAAGVAGACGKNLETKVTKFVALAGDDDEVTVESVEPSVPRVIARATTTAVDRLQRHPDVWRIFEHGSTLKPQLGSASRTQRSYDRNDRGQAFDATGYSVGVLELEGLPDPRYINLDETYDDADESAHATQVAYSAGSTASPFPGTARYADVFAAENPNEEFEEKMDWFNDRTYVVNSSFFSDYDGDRRLKEEDFLFDQQVANRWLTMVVGAGNDTTHLETGSHPHANVTSPGKGFNVITVGSVDDGNNGNRADDVVSSFSGHLSPYSSHQRGSDDDYPHQKPEVCAVGENVSMPLYIGNVSGTSFAGPQVAGLVTLLRKFADDYDAPGVGTFPALNKALVMASASHDAASYVDDRWGTGTIDVADAERIVERGWYVVDWFEANQGTQRYPLEVAADDEEVRLVLTWLTDVTEANFANTAEARSDVDLDLTVRDPDGEVVAADASYDRGWKAVAFQASKSGEHTIEVHNTLWESSAESKLVSLAWHRS